MKSQRKDTLLEVQGLVPPRTENEDSNDNEAENPSDNGEEDEDDEEGEDGEHKGTKNGKKPTLKKNRTMAATAAVRRQ